MPDDAIDIARFEPAAGHRDTLDERLRQPLGNAWYCVGQSSRFAPGRLRSVQLDGDRVLVGRERDGTIFALRDRCPHRGMALSQGRFIDGEITCPFHGWRFRSDGRCSGIPALATGDQADFSRIATTRFPAREEAGLAWVFLGRADPASAPAVPTVDFEASGSLVEELVVEASYDLVALSFVDPAHVAYVHDSWWWRSSKVQREKLKSFSPSPFGFTMTNHRASGASFVYRLLGGVPDVEIEFRLPGVRLERISVGNTRLANHTFATPFGPNRTAVINAMYWNRPLLNWVKPVARPFMRQFLKQDQVVLGTAQQGLDRKPTMVLVGQSDLPSQWYFRLKKEYIRAEGAPGPFVNPLVAQELSWRS